VSKRTVMASQTNPSKRDIQATTDAGAGIAVSAAPRLHDTAYDEIADVLIAKTERMASSRSAPRAVRC